MMRYDKLKEDYDNGKVDIEKFINFLTYCPGEEAIWGKKYGDDTAVPHEYFRYGIRIGCKLNICSECWLDTPLEEKYND